MGEGGEEEIADSPQRREEHREAGVQPRILEYATPVRRPADAGPVFRTFAGMMGAVEAVSAPPWLYVAWGDWLFMLIGFVGLLHAYWCLKLAITGHLPIDLDR